MIDQQSNLCQRGFPQGLPQGCHQGLTPMLPPMLLQSLHPRLTPRFPPNLPPRLSPWFPQVKYLRQSPLNFLQNIQSQFLPLFLLLVCDFIFLVFIVLNDCYICRIRVILYQNCHINYPLKCPQACPQGCIQV